MVQIKKYKKLLPAILMIFIAILLAVLSWGCSFESLEGRNVNYFGNIGRSNSYENYNDFLNENKYDDSVPDSNDAGAIVAPLPLSNQEFLFAATDGTIKMIMNTDVYWSKKLSDNQIVSAAMCIDAKQNSYLITNLGTIYSYDKEGNIRWKFSITDSIGLNDIPCDLLIFDDGIIAGITNGLIAKVSLEGKLLWKKNLNNNINKTLSGYNDNVMIILSSENDNDTLVSINSSGGESWRKSMDIRLIKYPVSNGSAIACCGLKYVEDKSIAIIFYLDVNGNILWKKEIDLIPRYISMSKAGNIYINTFQAGLGEQISCIYKYKNNGELVWKKYFNMTIPTPILISNKLLAFLGVTDKTSGLYFIGKDDGIIQGIKSFSNEKPFIHSPTVKPDGSVAFAYSQNLGFLKVDENWFKKLFSF